MRLQHCIFAPRRVVSLHGAARAQLRLGVRSGGRGSPRTASPNPPSLPPFSLPIHAFSAQHRDSHRSDAGSRARGKSTGGGPKAPARVKSGTSTQKQRRPHDRGATRNDPWKGGGREKQKRSTESRVRRIVDVARAKTMRAEDAKEHAARNKRKRTNASKVACMRNAFVEKRF